MYRNNKVKGFKSVLKCQQSTGSKTKDNQENIKKVVENSEENCHRSTTSILNLFKTPVEKSNKRIHEESDRRESKEPNKDDASGPCETIEEKSSTIIDNGKIIYNVVMAKKSTRKHKKWEDDGTLEVSGKHGILKDSDGKVIHRTVVDPDVLVEGFRMFVNSKEIEDWGENDTPEKEVSVDACLANTLRPHQRQGIIFLYECIMGLKVPNYFGAILADEMGLGKTLQCITIIWTLLKKGPHGKPVLKYVLIVTPSSLCDNWSKEFSHWLGFHRISPYVVNPKNKPKDFKKQSRNSVMIISYDMLIRCPEEIEPIQFDLIVCDEGHRLKNNDIKAAKILSNMNCKRKILLSGTPMQNDLQEFFALIDFVNPGILGTSSNFKRYYENPIVASQCPHARDSVVSLGTERASELQEKTKCFILRRTQDTINKYLPSKHELVVFCRLSDEQKDLYTRVTDAWFDKTVLPANTVPHLTVITMLKKICNHPDLFYNEKNDLLGIDFNSTKRNVSKSISGKISVVQTLMRNLKRTKEKLVLISYYTQTLDLLETICNSENLKFLRLDGSTASSVRSKIVQQFNSGSDESKVFLLSAKAGGVGLNLPGASRLVLFDSDWNPASDSQAMARIWREGQKKNVYLIRLLTIGTIEEKIFQRQISKANLSETVVDVNNFASLKLSMSELKDLFTLATETNCLTHDLIKCSCNGRKEVGTRSEKCDNENNREHQLVLQDEVTQSNITINQLLEWEHYQQPIPDKILQELMLLEISDNITFLFKNSTINEVA
ncbi:DNA repair and recombination protein RAD54B isoform X2 [Lasioglossum baleicum]|uniref:DNA repair and recombination protein RAD54B isoform X2 n=1 Tax=Lasioglossum baleicum TaxID=434251 RepID=UPI003FCDADA4